MIGYRRKAGNFVGAAGTLGTIYTGARGLYRGAQFVRNKYAKAIRKPNPSRYPKQKKILRPKKTLKAVAKEVNSLKKRVSTMNTLYTKKYRAFGSLTAATNQTGYVATALNNSGVVNGVIDAVKYFNPSAPSTLINVDLTAPTYQQKVRIVRSHLSYTIRNNFSVPCYVDAYFLKVKKDTSIDPDTAMSNSLADMSNAGLTSSQIYPSDCHDFKDLWRIIKHKRIRLDAGKEFIFSAACPSFEYDISLSDSQTESYLKYMHASCIMIRVEGIVGHGSTSGVDMMQCGVDYEVRRIHTVEYSGGVNTEYIEVDDNTQVISGTHQCSQLTNEQAAYAR